MSAPRLALAVLLLALAVFAAPPAAQAQDPVRVAFHVDENDPQLMNMVLNNVQNLSAHYAAQNRPVQIEVVAYGPGLNMYRADSSPVKDRISQMALSMDSLTFSACENTLRGMEKKSGGPVALIDEATLTPSGVVRLVELQADGWAYVRP
ncbi:DsrE family protein [Albimonas sp. CAU 1670]|uniref:DsrE family protein n=1 Tax=Albimonas sp. CAU 1670 TaxID=3032599 RepID=UPI0023DA69E8|nr:DsrE family protein [Albimonas sp. CAU 1670]MDF2231820.1 DsrE family protein [Albimonas sp. CAU 1670]